ncbi:antiviral innate immune response receptor RIG-I-like [Saccostrea echinata]|uniref:antiviral innate immune response receptor RIG-I-like n=1 Tax=Saccostrea echinata TaxID=191078 RepID=UPI002A8267B9|nr:antiviral innate immune response receptor RIG-I-like [Saccostrea echinata]
MEENITQKFVTDVVEHLEPTDILDYFPALNDDDIYTIEQLQKNGKREDACLSFLDLVLKHDDTTVRNENINILVNAFREEGYQRLVESYENADESDQTATTEFMEFLIKMTKPDLMNEIDAASLIPILLEKGYLKVKDQQYLNSLQVGDRSEACKEMVRRIKKKHKDWAVALFNALKQTQPNLLTKLDPGATNEELVQKGLASSDTGPLTEQPESEEEEYNSDLEKYDNEESEKSQKRRKVPEMNLRPYQLELAETADSGQNTIICAHTGTGKTWVALHITKEHLLKNPDGRVVFLARTNALVEQQYNLFQKYLPDRKVYHLHTATKECLGMHLIINDHQVFFMTPQILLNNINNKRVSLGEITLLILDECHHSRKKEPYNNVMKHYLARKRNKETIPQIVGLTATIGVGDSSTEDGALQHMLRICANLDTLEISTVRRNLEEFQKHVAVPKEETIKMGQKEKDPLKILIFENIAHIEAYIKTTELMNNKHLLPMWNKRPDKKDGKHYQKWTVHFRNKVSCKLRNNKELVRVIYTAMTHLAAYNEALDVNYLMNKEHVIEHMERKFEEDLKTLDSASEKEREFLLMIIEFCKKVEKMKVEMNPYLKLMRDKVVELVTEYEEIKGMVFVQTRATAFALAQYLSQELGSLGNGGLRAGPFTGTNSSETSRGMPDTQKNETLENFKRGILNVLVATSVGSEGIDVPDCNFIITYNYTGNEANVIQMSGRARQKSSTVAHISDQAIQKREEISLQKAKLMYEAFRRLNSMLPEDRRRKILNYQEEIRVVGDLFSSEEDTYKVKKPFRLICFKCHADAVNSEDLRIYVGQHRVVTNPDFRSRCDFDKSTAPSRYTISTIKCAKCKLKWGTTFKIDEFEIPVLKVAAFLFESAGEEPRKIKKWGRVDFFIESINKSDLLEIYKEIVDVEETEEQ